MEWIKFKEQKPPKEHKQYLVAIKYNEQDVISFYDMPFWDGEHFTYYDNYNDGENHYMDEDVYAWMEFPKCEITEKIESEVTIDNKLDPTTTLYHNGVKIGDIKNATALDNVLAQIHTKNANGEDAKGYYIMWNDEKIDILPTGRIPHPPYGFYSSTAESLEIIFDI